MILEQKTIMNMTEDNTYRKCSFCKQIVKPHYSFYDGFPYLSNLDWCPNCLKGELTWFWITQKY